MESNTIKAYFRKLLDSLKISKQTSGRIEVDPESERLVTGFSVVSDGIALKGSIFFPKAEPDRLYPTIIICHGIPGSGEARPDDDPGYEALAHHFASLGLAAVIFNFRGCGESEGDFDMAGWTRDLETVLDHVKNTPHIDPTRIIILGFSGGGAAAVKVAAESDSIYAMAIVGTPAHFRIFEEDPLDIVEDFQGRGIIRDPDFPANIDEWIKGFEEVEPLKWISHFKGRHLLIVHGEDDELIPLEHARELSDYAPGGITKTVAIPGGAHRLRLDPRLIHAVTEWLKEIVRL
jgi:pimeloyl-ACP methyl ester carboxylesterase